MRPGAGLGLSEGRLNSSAPSCCFKKLWTLSEHTDTARLPDGLVSGTVISPLSPNTRAPSLEVMGCGRGMACFRTTGKRGGGSELVKI